MHLAKKAYERPPVTFDEKSLSNAVEKLYPQSVPQYDSYHPAYNEQLKRLSDIYLHLVKHSTGALAHQNAIRIFFPRLSTPTYFSGTQNFYKETKLGLEHILVLLATKSEAVKRSTLTRLCRQLEKCSAGIYAPIQTLSFELREQHSIPEILAKHRKAVLDKMAEDYVQGPLTQKMMCEYKAQGDEKAKQQIEDLSIAVYSTMYQLASRCNLGVPMTKKFSELKNLQTSITGLVELTPELFLEGFQLNCTAESSLAYLVAFYKDQFDHYAKMGSIEGEQLNINFKKLIKPFVDNNVYGLYDALKCSEEKPYKTTLNPLFLEKLESHVRQLLVKTGFLGDEKYTPVISPEVVQNEEARVHDAQVDIVNMVQLAPNVGVSMRMVRAEMAVFQSLAILGHAALLVASIGILAVVLSALLNVFKKPWLAGIMVITGASLDFIKRVVSMANLGLHGLQRNAQGLAENTTPLVIPVLNGVVQAVLLTLAAKLVIERLGGVELPATMTLMTSIFVAMVPGNMIATEGRPTFGMFLAYRPRRPAAALAEAAPEVLPEGPQDNAQLALNVL